MNSARGVSARRNGPLRVVVVDDHPVVRKGLVQVIDDAPDFAVCGEAETVQGGLAVVAAQHPDLAVVDLGLGAESGLELVSALTASHPAVRVLVLSMRDEMLYAERALRAGASGYIMKHAPLPELLTAMRRIAGGRTYVSARVSQQVLSTLTGRRAKDGSVSPIDRLTDRERQVLDLTGRGLGTRDIARQMNVAVKTVESHCAHIKEKLGLATGRELVRFAVTWTQSG